MPTSVRLVPLAAAAATSLMLVALLLHCRVEDPLAAASVNSHSVLLLTASGHRQQIPRLNSPQRTPGSVRLVMLSDTHTHHSELDIPDGDILIHAGDYASARDSAGRLREKKAFDEWYAQCWRRPTRPCHPMSMLTLMACTVVVCSGRLGRLPHTHKIFVQVSNRSPATSTS